MNYLRSKNNNLILEKQEKIQRFKKSELKVTCYKNATNVPYFCCVLWSII